MKITDIPVNNGRGDKVEGAIS